VSNYKIRVKIEIVESEGAISVAPEQVSGGLFEFNRAHSAVGGVQKIAGTYKLESA
jgi:hypothetical protein